MVVALHFCMVPVIYHVKYPHAFFSFKKGMYVCLGFFVGRGHFLKYIYKYIRVYECE